jgi:hypothetical protein
LRSTRACRAPVRRFFVECGTTLGRAAFGLTEGLDRGTLNHPFDDRVRRFGYTNNDAVFRLLPLMRKSHSRLKPTQLYGNLEFDAEVGGFFPISEHTIERALKHVRPKNNGEKPTRRGGDAVQTVESVWKDHLNEAIRFDQLFMTASHFSFVFGPFVGSSLRNVLLKSAFFTSGRHIALLIDGLKVDDYTLTRRLWGSGSIQVFDKGDSVFQMYPQWKQVLGEDDIDGAMDLQHKSSERNPIVKLKLNKAWVRNPQRKERGEPKHLPVTTPGSWGQCVRANLEVGNIDVWISQPENQTAEEFVQHITNLVAIANACLSHPLIRLEIPPPEQHTVYVDPRTFCVSARPVSRARPVMLCRCRYARLPDLGQTPPRIPTAIMKR